MEKPPQQPNAHHLVLGELKDILTGQMLPDTLDERYRQKICDLAIKKGFDKSEIQARFPHVLKAGERNGSLIVDFSIRHEKKTVILIKYAPGSLVTRRLFTLALSRTVEPYQIPFAVITNGEDAEIIDGASGKVIASGLDSLPDKKTIEKNFKIYPFTAITPALFDKASRIAFACGVEGACPCDTDVCLIE